MLALLALLLAACILQLSGLRKDIRSDAFIDPDNPALVYRDLVRETFGLADPMLVALVARDPGGIYTPDFLAALVELTERLNALENVDENATVSLATETLIEGSSSGLDVKPLMGPVAPTERTAKVLRRRLDDYPILRDGLVADDGSATLIVLQLDDETRSEATYAAILQLLDAFPLPAGVSAHVAGEGAIAGYLGAYIDADARVLNPLAGVIIIGIIALVFRRLAPAFLALLMILASVSVALGTMAAVGIPFYVITNALPVILVGIAVADTIHVCSVFFALQARAPQRSRESLVVETMARLWLPISITSVTTAAGFLGLFIASDMPPFRYFGLFTALGVFAAWLYSLFALPGLMLLLRMQVNQRSINRQREGKQGPLARLMVSIGSFARAWPRQVVGFFLLLALAGALGASRLHVDDDRVALFAADEPISRASAVINERLNGTSILDVVVETDAPEELFEPEVLHRIEALQIFAEAQPGVTVSRSIVDYIEEMNHALSDGEGDGRVIPGTREAIAQLMLLYSFASDPSDLDDLVDYDYRLANVRISLNSSRYQDFAPTVEAIQAYVDRHMAGAGLSVSLSGRIALDYHWLKQIGETHLLGLLATLLMVWVVSSLSFRSLLAGLYTLLPVVASVLLVYAFMALSGLALGVGTSMFAAVAVGLGVDFAIHVLSHMLRIHRSRKSCRTAPCSLDDDYREMFAGTGTALLVNLLAVACGFGVLLASKVSQLAAFGGIVMLCMVVSFLASVALLPALAAIRLPGFMQR